jgi:hypothetical protein
MSRRFDEPLFRLAATPIGAPLPTADTALAGLPTPASRLGVELQDLLRTMNGLYAGSRAGYP